MSKVMSKGTISTPDGVGMLEYIHRPSAITFAIIELDKLPALKNYFDTHFNIEYSEKQSYGRIKNPPDSIVMNMSNAITDGYYLLYGRENDNFK